MKQGIVYVPYTIEFKEHDNEPSSEYNLFKKAYKKLHEACPVCNGIIHSTTLVGYVLNLEKKEEYKDRNICQCLDCGYEHLTHDRVPLKEKE